MTGMVNIIIYATVYQEEIASYLPYPSINIGYIPYNKEYLWTYQYPYLLLVVQL